MPKDNNSQLLSCDKKGIELIDKDVAYGMMLNALCQVRDIINGEDIEEITVNPDMEKFDDMSLDEVITIAKHFEN